MGIAAYLLITLLALPVLAFGVFALMLITGVIREPEGAKAAAMAYRNSWRALRRLS